MQLGHEVAEIYRVEEKTKLNKSDIVCSVVLVPALPFIGSYQLNDNINYMHDLCTTLEIAFH